MKKLLSTLFALTLCLSFMIITSQASDQPVELFDAEILGESTPPNYLDITYHAKGNIMVKDLAYDKNVIVHYTYDDITWHDVPAYFVKNLGNGEQLWSFNTPKTEKSFSHQINYYCKFAIRYEVNGQTYWDNNGGSNYEVRTSTTTGNKPVVLGRREIRPFDVNITNARFSGFLFAKNLGYDKEITVRYTTDNWATYHEVNAQYEPYSTEYGQEKWKFFVYGDFSNQTIEYAVRYKVNGQTYWDNNFGDNYKLPQ